MITYIDAYSILLVWEGIVGVFMYFKSVPYIFGTTVSGTSLHINQMACH